jgi:5-(carboxyamino)imidazole ribonucleotide mutase
MSIKIAIVMGSDSDLPVMQEAAKLLEELKIAYFISVVSAHRTPDRLVDFSKNAHKNGYDVIIAGAGGAAHLPGMIAAHTHLPVIGVPIKSSNMSGIDSLYSIVQMPPGVPVATMAINGAKNAGIMAASILALQDKDIAQNLIDYKRNMESTVLEKAKNLEDKGYQNYK